MGLASNDSLDHFRSSIEPILMHFANDLVDVRTKVALLLSEQDNLVGNNLEHQEDHATKLYMFINFMESMDEWISQVMTSWAHYHLKRSRLQEQLQEASSDDLWQALILTDITHGQELCSVLYTLLLRYIWLEDIVREAQATEDEDAKDSSSALQLAPGQLQQ